MADRPEDKEQTLTPEDCLRIAQLEPDEDLQQEIDVLLSIYPEIIRRAPRQLRLTLESDEPYPTYPTQLTLELIYPETYPHAPPHLSFPPPDPLEQQPSEPPLLLSLSEEQTLHTALTDLAETSLGEAMTFTLLSALPSLISDVLRARIDLKEADKRAADAAALERELAKTRGTSITRENFLAWKARFEAETKRDAVVEENDRLAKLSGKEREEERRRRERRSGREIFLNPRSAAAAVGGPDEGAGEEEGQEEVVDYRMLRALTLNEKQQKTDQDPHSESD